MIINENISFNSVSAFELTRLKSGIKSPRLDIIPITTPIFRFASSFNRSRNKMTNANEQVQGPWWLSVEDYLKIEREYWLGLSMKRGNKSTAMPLGWYARRAAAIKQEWSNVDLLIRAEVVASVKVFKGLGIDQNREPYGGKGFGMASVYFSWNAWKSIEQIFIPNLDPSNVGKLNTGEILLKNISIQPIDSIQLW